MDIKTLEYMTGRVNKGSEILNKIEELKKSLNICRKAETITFTHWKTDKRVKIEHLKQEEPDFGIHLASKLINTAIDSIVREIQQLEEEFAKL